MQEKLFQRCTHFKYCSVLSLGGNVNTWQMSQPDMESIFTYKTMKYSGHRKLFCELSKLSKLKCFYHPRILDEHWCIYSCLQIPPKENWFQYVRRLNATPISFPCIITLVISKQKYIGISIEMLIEYVNSKACLRYFNWLSIKICPNHNGTLIW